LLRDLPLGELRLLPAVSWMLRGLLGIGGALLVYSAWPVARSALHAQGADTTMSRLREPAAVSLRDALAAIEALDLAIQADPSARNHLDRSELLVGAAFVVRAPDSQREQWLRTAAADLEIGLARAPARGIAWLRLAVVRQALAGPSAQVVAPLIASIEVVPVVPRLWPVRLELILRNWAWFDDVERERMAAYVAMTWRATSDRRWFVRAMRENVDELLIRLLLNDVEGAQDELSTWMRLVRP
jgi:hypothetical protein